jgi:hypothetical protein
MITTEEVEAELASKLDAKALSTQPIVRWGSTYAVALRCSQEADPVFVSPGHRISMSSAAVLAKRCCAGFLIPMPVHYADAAGRAHVKACCRWKRHSKFRERSEKQSEQLDGRGLNLKSNRPSCSAGSGSNPEQVVCDVESTTKVTTVTLKVPDSTQSTTLAENNSWASIVTARTTRYQALSSRQTYASACGAGLQRSTKLNTNAASFVPSLLAQVQ